MTSLRKLMLLQLATGAILLAAIGLATWVTEHGSCERSVPARTAVQERSAVDRDEARWYQARGRTAEASFARRRARVAEPIKLPDCSRLLPDR